MPNCKVCDKKIFSSPNKAFTVLVCGHTYHRICIEKKLLLTKPNGCPECGKSVETITETTTTETDLRRESESSTSSIVGRMGKQLTIQSQKIIDEEMSDVDNGENNSKGKDIDIAGGSQKRPIEVSSEETTTAPEKSSSKKAKKEVKPVDREKSANLKKLIDELLSNYIHPQVDEVVEESGGLYKRYKEYKKDNGKESSNALVFDDVTKQNPKVSDTALRKRMERARKIYKLFTAIVNGDEK
ncbi:10324_t:CDS:2 [Diversispora eburnea]|uniref:10324_t:CDS:1 n=1 Tax=Diversispora eburnea TaxID=1213867 RepID=A0A9N9G5J0_9GLOM|nr:10324_t:CDS:2 [Diversispora eburnea]